MPMFYGQIKMQKYLEDPEISFSAIGDAIVEENPAIQVSEFGQGNSIDDIIRKLVIVGNGGGNEKESFELAAYFYNEYCMLNNAEFPFFFLTGDEGFYENVPKKYFNDVFGINLGNSNEFVSGREIIKKLMTKFNVFHLKKAYISHNKEEIIHKQWADTIGEERVLQFTEPKACVDIMLGAISLTTGVRTLDTYIKDMKIREQTKPRIEMVTQTLQKYADKLAQGSIAIVKTHNDSYTNTNSQQTSDIKQDSSSLKKTSLFIPQNELTDIREITQKLILGYSLTDEKLKFVFDLKKLKSQQSNLIPVELICPITNEIFVEPVIADDGVTYEDKAIICWLTNKDISPVTGKKLNNKNLTVNSVIVKAVKLFYENNVDLLK